MSRQPFAQGVPIGFWFGSVVWGIALAGGACARAGEGARHGAFVGEGEALFRREWVPGAPTAHGGDGLGPVYNARSCVACHNLGGAGGAGGADSNVKFLTAVVIPVKGEPSYTSFGPLTRIQRRVEGLDRQANEPPPKERAPGEEADRGPLTEFHAAFRDASSVVVHRFETNADHQAGRLAAVDPDGTSAFRLPRSSRFGTRSNVFIVSNRTAALRGPFPARLGHFALTQSQLNPPALFGAGLIDSIPEAVLEDAANRVDPVAWEVNGRVSRLRDGRIGRFGWKAQSASLDEFVQTACAVELGLEVPDRHQAMRPEGEPTNRKRLDLDRTECDSLTAFIADLPPPAERPSRTAGGATAIAMGRDEFTAVGCAACHVPRLGQVVGIYGDLLLHDMGSDLSGQTAYYGITPPDTNEGGPPGSFPLAEIFPCGADAFQGAPPFKGAGQREWRTPPLWGVRDTAPYMHDGRAHTIEEAIALHGGEADRTTRRYLALAPTRRRALLAFVNSIGAPGRAQPIPLDEDPHQPRPAARYGLQARSN
jgi:CxxC motif-containing protein (DUF1111 family)